MLGCRPGTQTPNSDRRLVQRGLPANKDDDARGRRAGQKSRRPSVKEEGCFGMRFSGTELRRGSGCPSFAPIS